MFKVESIAKRCVIVLNRPIRIEPKLFLRVWQSSALKLCADGGYNQLHVFSVMHAAALKPDAVIGDFDSSVDVPKDIKLVVDKNQNATDLDKCIAFAKTQGDYEIVVVSEFDGRVDHCFALLNALFVHDFVLLSECNVTIKCKEGVNQLDFSSSLYGTCVGILPMKPTRVKTDGLEWDMDGETGFGGLISTSNQLKRRQITLECSSPVLLTVQTRAQ